MSTAPVPLSQFVLKVHSRCDLACDHCYVYEAADQSWRGRPMVMSGEVIRQTARRIADYAASQELADVQVVLHGGEPLLAGRARLRQIVSELRSALRDVCRLDLRIHTNGVQLNQAFCELFAEYGVKVGFSIDGDRAANDRHRRYADGRSSYDRVVAAIELVRTGPFRDLYAGLLCTIDLANDPLVTYESLMGLGPPRIDFLLPHATWDHPPARTPGADSEYASWLIAIFDRWVADGSPTRIRTFDSILSTLRGGRSYTEALGLEAASLVVIETDGSYEQVDSLKAAFDGAPGTGTNVFEHGLDIVARHPGIQARQQGTAGLCRTCQECPVVTSCGGGLYTHRYRTGNGFANPSAYCADLLGLISHIGSRLPAQPAAGPRTAAHSLSGTSFRALAGGSGGAAAVGQLIDAERSLRRGLLVKAYQAAMANPEVPGGVKAALRGAWAVLAAVTREQPQALDAVLGHPYVRVWAARGLEHAGPAVAWHGDESQARITWKLSASPGHLGAIAASAAIRARMGAAVTIPVIDAAVHLPTLGRLALSPVAVGRRAAGTPEAATVSVIRNAVIIGVGDACWTMGLAGLLAGDSCAVPVDGTARAGEWQPLRMLRGPGYCVALEDTDPFRDCYEWPAAPRLSATDFAAWQRVFGDAWQEIGREDDSCAAALGAGLTTLVPLAVTPDSQDTGTSTRNAFGAIATALPRDARDLAGVLLREFANMKLGALLDLCDLYDAADNRLFPVQGGEGKQQLREILRSAYAGLAASSFWRERQLLTTGSAADLAGQRFAQSKTHTREAIAILLGSGSLTPIGTSFVEEMRRSVSP